MAAKQHLDQLKRQIEQLSKDSLSVVTNANKIVYNGVQKLADRELKALNDYYHSAVASIRNANKGDLRGLAQQQLDLLQDTVNQVISHARESIGIVAETRAELAKLVQKGARGEKIAASELKKATAPARNAVKKAKVTAKRAAKSAKKSAKSTARQVKAGTTKALASGKRTAVVAARAVEHAIPTPSPNSRASRATSKAKKAAGNAVASVSQVVTNLSSNVSNVVSGAVNAVTDAVKNQG
jgi:hypothetical protein